MRLTHWLAMISPPILYTSAVNVRCLLQLAVSHKNKVRNFCPCLAAEPPDWSLKVDDSPCGPDTATPNYRPSRRLRLAVPCFSKGRDADPVACKRQKTVGRESAVLNAAEISIG
jgi:hypothetical protein